MSLVAIFGNYITPTPAFSPTSISGLTVWLDGADPLATGTAPSTGTTIATWYDKSGNSYNGASFGSGTPTMSANGIVFNGTRCYNILLYTCAPSTETIFIVVNTGTIPTSSAVDLVSGKVVGNRQFQLNRFTNRFEINRIGTGGPAGTAAIPINTRFMYDFTYNQTNTSAYLNGTTDINGQSSLVYNSNTNTVIGGTIFNGSLVNALTGTISEVVIYNSSLGTTDRQIVEGYLAWKWGIESSLPAGHPYKSAPP